MRTNNEEPEEVFTAKRLLSIVIVMGGLFGSVVTWQAKQVIDAQAVMNETLTSIRVSLGTQGAEVANVKGQIANIQGSDSMQWEQINANSREIATVKSRLRPVVGSFPE
jgi:hypothetical protein